MDSSTVARTRIRSVIEHLCSGFPFDAVGPMNMLQRLVPVGLKKRPAVPSSLK